VVELPSAASFMNIQHIIDIVKKHEIDAVHPGYGFLSESDEFAKRMWDEAGAVVVGPGWGLLAKTGDKLRARGLAEECEYTFLKFGKVRSDTLVQAMFLSRQLCKHQPTTRKTFESSPAKSATPSWSKRLMAVVVEGFD
jgi:pyruvate carboxylase